MGLKFLAPMSFWFAAAIPVLIVFYLLKRKRVVKLISSTLLWQKFLAETQASAPFQKLRHNWLLLLQLLLLGLVIFALARPYLSGSNKPSQMRVLILDASASMQSRDVAPSRFEQARAEALHWIDGMRDTDRMVILQAAGSTEVKQSATSDRSALRRALHECRVTDAPTRLMEAFKLAETLVRDQTDAEIHLFSDGAMPSLDELENKNLPLVYHRVGKRSENAGIIALDVRANPDNTRERAVFANVGNYATNSRDAELELRFDNTVVAVRPVSIPATNSVPLVFVVPQTNDGTFTLQLKGQDDLASDDRASIISLMPQPAKALLVTRGNGLLERALRATGQIELQVSSSMPSAAETFDFVVLDDVVPTTWPQVNTFAIHVINTNWFSTWEVVQNPGLVDWRGNHPLLRSVTFDTVSVREAYRVKLAGWGVPILEAPQTPLIVAGERDRHRVLWIGFDVLESSWPLRVSFPIFVANAVEWLNPAATRSRELMVKAGEPFRMSLGETVGRAEVTRPDGSKAVVVTELASREIIFGDTDQQGKYLLRAGTNEVTFCVNLLDAVESNIQPRDELPFGKYGTVTATNVRRADVELWRWIAGAGLMILLLEWWYYHRRTA